MKDLTVHDHDLFGLPAVMTQCANCPTVVPLIAAVVSTFHITETWTEQEHFCSDQCAKAWWETFQARND